MISEAISAVTSAINLTSRLQEIEKTVRDAEYRNILADLRLHLADVKLRLADLIEENRQLSQKVAELESTTGQRCPKCNQLAWNIIDSRPHPVTGRLGGIERTYQCGSCGFQEKYHFDSGSQERVK